MAFYQHKHSLVIKAHLQKLMHKFLDCSNDYARKNRRCILQSERHYSVLKTSPFSCEGCLASIFTCDFDLKEYTSWPPKLSNTSSVNGGGKGSCTQASFNFLRSTHILISSFCFFSYTTIGLNQSDSSTGSMMPATSIFSSSKQTFSLYFKLRW